MAVGDVGAAKLEFEIDELLDLPGLLLLQNIRVLLFVARILLLEYFATDERIRYQRNTLIRYCRREKSGRGLRILLIIHIEVIFVRVLFRKFIAEQGLTG